MSRRIKTICLAVIIFFSSISFIQAAELKLDIALYDYEPFFFKTSGGEIRGLCFEFMKLIEQNSNVRFNYSSQFIPLKRIAFLSITGKYDTVFCVTKSKVFSKLANYADTPLMTYEYVAAVRADDSVSISSIDDILALGEKGRILAQSGASVVGELSDIEGLIIEDSARTMETNFKKLERKRGRFFISSTIQLQWALKKKEYREKFKVLPFSFKTVDSYVVFSKFADDEKLAAVNKVLIKLTQTGQLKKTVKKYIK